jgi:hypothetical protein
MIKEVGTWIPRNLQEHMMLNGFKLTHVFIVSAVHSFEKSKLRYFASNNFIGTQLGVTPRRVRQIITDLEHSGWLKRDVTVGVSGSERNIVTTEKTKDAINFPPREGKKDLPPGKDSTPNIKDYNKLDSKILTTTSTKQVLSDDAIRCLIGKDISNIDKEHEVFGYYDAAHRWSLLRENVDIPRNPNTSVIISLLSEYESFGSAGDFVYFLDGRWIKRNVKDRESSVNISWLALLDGDDEMMKNGILSVEGNEEYTIKSVNELVKSLS